MLNPNTLFFSGLATICLGLLTASFWNNSYSLYVSLLLMFIGIIPSAIVMKSTVRNTSGGLTDSSRLVLPAILWMIPAGFILNMFNIPELELTPSARIAGILFAAFFVACGLVWVCKKSSKAKRVSSVLLALAGLVISFAFFYLMFHRFTLF